jgi:predicted amidohydrolase YtcJ
MTNRLTRSFLAVSSALLLGACSPSGPSADVADVVYVNGRIYTVNEAQPWVEAVAIKDGMFLVVGSNADAEAVTGDATEVIDLGGDFAMPGIVDAHIHPYEPYVQAEAGNLLFSDQLDVDGIAAAIREFAAANPDSEWIRGMKYGFAAFDGAKMTREWLDEIVPDRPAYMVDESGHNATANSRALEIAGITADTPDPPLGAIDRDPVTGEPTGYLSETAMGLVGRHIDRPPPDAYKRAIERSLEQMTAWGITSFIDMMALESSLDAYFELDAEGKLPFRLNVALAMNEYTDEVATADEARAYLPQAIVRATEKIDTNHFKYWGDGTPLSYTSLLVEPYADRDTYGSITMTDEMIEDAIGYLRQGIGGHIHSITDGTTRRILDLVEEARERYPGQVRRFHIGHNQLVHPDDYARYADLDVVAEIGPAMWFPFGATPVLIERLGEERALQRYFDVRSMLDAGVTVAWGSDWPAGTPDANAFRGLEGLVTRAHPSGDFEGSFGTPISLEEGIRIITLGSAYAMEREDSIGSIEVGKHADFIVLDRNLFEIPPETIYDTVVKRTVFAGETVHEAN